MEKQIKVFGAKADKIEHLESFVAFKKIVEGRTVVELIPVNDLCEECYKPLEEVTLYDGTKYKVCLDKKCYNGHEFHVHDAWKKYINGDCEHYHYVAIRDASEKSEEL